MKTALTFLILLTLIPLNAFAQDSPQWGLPDDALARLGKGIISGNIVYSPDGNRLAVASAIGVWVYDTTTYEPVFPALRSYGGSHERRVQSGRQHDC